MSAMTLPRSTAALALSAAIATTAYLVLTVQISAAYIAEDAAILMRYAHHLGAGLGFVWNPGEPPLDGATDWLGTTLLGGLYSLGISLELGPRLLAGAAHIATVALVVLIMRAALGAPLVPTLLSIVFVMLGPARAYIQAGFLAPLFAMTVLTTWSCVVCAAVGARGPWAALFALGTILAALTRPEGLLLSGLMLGASWLLLERPLFRRFVVATILISGSVLLLFALWRWRYFGRLLPLPFLKKGGGALHWDGLSNALKGAVYLLGWVIPLIALGLRGGRSLRWVGALAIVCVGFLVIWVLVSSEMNYFWRFQYALVPLAASTWWAAAGPTWSETTAAIAHLPRASRRSIAVVLFLAGAGLLTWQYRQFSSVSSSDGLLSTALVMRDLGPSGRRLVTTEAGLLPLYSGWTTTDAWGLNDPRIVREGTITDAYLTEIDPDVIVFHAYYTPLTTVPSPVSDWDRMVAVLHQFAVCHGYSLAAVFAPEFSQAHYYFVNPRWPGAQTFRSAIRSRRYGWAGSLVPAMELSDFQKDSPRCGS